MFCATLSRPRPMTPKLLIGSGFGKVRETGGVV